MTSKVHDDAGINTNLYKKNPYVKNFHNKSMTQSDLAREVAIDHNKSELNDSRL